MDTDPPAPTLRYDRGTIWLHWLTALFVLLAWGMAQIIDDFPPGALRVDARSVHIVFGLTVAVILALRVWYRSTRGRELPPADRNIELQALAKATHWTLYILIGTQVTLGMIFAASRGDSIFGLFNLPGAADRAIRQTLGSAHGFLGNCILYIAGFHAAAALLHHFVWRDGTLRRMLPGR
ncbi:MAG: cytochrome b [Acidisphaera sp.]|nr:cytochrome b [Acidisphaera sp.]MBV9811906.1 cytochrome b [Acetobacteraceae bacterium]